MTLILNAKDVERCTDMAAIVNAIEAAVLDESTGRVIQPERLNVVHPDAAMRIMPVMMPGVGVYGFKVFGHAHGVWRYLIAVYDANNGDLLTLADGSYLTAVRTGAATGVATKWLARPDVRSVGVIGSGLESRTNLRAVLAARPGITHVRVFSPHADRRTAFAHDMSAELGIDVTPVNSPQEAVAGVDVVNIATFIPVSDQMRLAYRGAWVEPGQHVNAIGSTGTNLREMDPEVFARADLLVADAAWEQLERESGDVIAAIQANSLDRSRVAMLKDVVAGRISRPGPAAVTLYKSVGTGLQDVAAAHEVYIRARELGLGTAVPDFPVPRRLG